MLSPLEIRYEIILVNDGSKDNFSEVIQIYISKDTNLKLIDFSRNFGNQAAISAGLKYCSGEMTVVMDDDLEDPPEFIPELIEKAKEGYDVVYALRKKRRGAWHKLLLYKSFHRLLKIMSDFPIPEDTGDFCLMRKKIVDTLNTMPERNRYIRGLRSWVGFSQIGIEFERDLRFSGSSGFNLWSYIKFGLDGILSFSKKPLYFVTVLGIGLSMISLLVALRIIIMKLSGLQTDVPGYASIATAIFFIGGLQLFSIGIIGQYVGRIYDESKSRPPFVIKNTIGFDE